MCAVNRHFAALVIVLSPMVGFALGQSEQEYIGGIEKKYGLSMEIAFEEPLLLFSYAPVRDGCFYYGEEEKLKLRCGGQEQTIPFPPELEPDRILGAGPEYYIPETGKLYAWIGYRRGDSDESLFYIYDTRTQVWESVPFVDGKDVYRILVMRTGKIVVIPRRENSMTVFDPEQEIVKQYSYGSEESFFPFQVGMEFYSFGRTLIGFKKANYEPNGGKSLILFDVETETYNEYVLPSGNYRNFVFLEDRTFYCIEDYEFLSGALRRSRIVEINIETNAVEVVALADFDRELYDLRQVERNLYSFIVDTGKVAFGSSGRGGGHRVLFTIRLPK